MTIDSTPLSALHWSTERLNNRLCSVNAGLGFTIEYRIADGMVYAVLRNESTGDDTVLDAAECFSQLVGRETLIWQSILDSIHLNHSPERVGE